MTRLLQGMLRLAALPIALCLGSVALAPSSLAAPASGTSAVPGMADVFVEEDLGMRVRIFDDKGTELQPTHYHFADQFGALVEYIVPQGNYTVEVVFYGEALLSEKGAKPVLLKTTEVTFDGGASDIEVDEHTGKAQVVARPLPPDSIADWWSKVGLSSVGLAGGAKWVKVGAPTTGVLPTTDTPLVQESSHVTTYGFEAGVNLYTVLYTAAVVSLAKKFFEDACWWDIGAWWGDHSASAQVPAGTEAGWAYWQPAPNGSTGLSSALGTDAQSKTKYNDVHVDWMPPNWFGKYGNWWVQGRPKLEFDYSESKFNGSLFNTVAPGVSSMTDQKVQQTDFSVGYGLWGMYPLPNHSSAAIGIGIDAIYYDGRYHGMQINMCSICTANKLYDVTASDSKSGLTVGGWVNPVLKFMAGSNAQIFVEGMYRYVQKGTFVTSKVTPSDAAPHLDTASHDFAKVAVGVLVKF